LQDNGTFLIRIAAPPIDGRANKEIIRLLSEILEIPKSGVEITNGSGCRHKTIELEADSSMVQMKLNQYIK
jgi:uncharacterized protein (TIGR00251 family)